MRPQLSTLVDQPPSGENWLHEMKFDGYRLLCFVNGKNIKLLTRNQQNWTSKFPTLKAQIAKLKLGSAILDGELVAIDENKQSNFQLLQNRLHEKNTDTLVYYVFDLPYYKEQDLTTATLLERKALLRKIIPRNNPTILYSDHIIGHGANVFRKSCKLRLEGIISKEIHSPYVQKRTRDWLKTKCINRQEFIVGGYTQPRGGRQYFGSLLLGTTTKAGKLQYCGRVGTGFTDKTLTLMATLLEKNKISTMPFLTQPPDSKNVSWVKPKLIVEVEFIEWTQDRILRHPSFKGLRKDKSAKHVKIEISDHASDTPKLTHPDRILFPELGITKLAVAQFYESINDKMLPYIINRPLTLLRCPQGRQQQCFYQRHLTDVPDFIYIIDTKERPKHKPYFYIKDLDGLIALVQLGALEIHLWGARIDDVDKPDMIIFDLDPSPEVEWTMVVKAARFVRAELEKLKLTSFVKTTGGKGLHVVIPIKRLHTWEEVKIFSHTFVQYIVSLKPDLYTDVMTKAKRKGKIYLDYLRNQRGATAIAPYSTRAKANAPIATPLRWEELSTKIKSDTYTLTTYSRRLKKLQTDPWEGFFDLKQKLAL